MFKGRPTTLPILTLAALLFLASCGGGDASSDDGKAEVPAAEAPSSAFPVVTTPTEKICGEMDRADAATILEVPQGKTATFGYVAGEERKSSAGDAIKDKSGDPLLWTSTGCDITAKEGAEALLFSVADAKTSADKMKTYAKDQEIVISSYVEDGGVCEKVQDPGFGEPSWGDHCSGLDGGSGSLQISGVFGKTVVNCTLFTYDMSDDLPAKVAPLTTTCLDAVEAIASS